MGKGRRYAGLWDAVRDGFVFQAHRLLYHSTKAQCPSRSCIESKEEEEEVWDCVPELARAIPSPALERPVVLFPRFWVRGTNPRPPFQDSGSRMAFRV